VQINSLVTVYTTQSEGIAVNITPNRVYVPQYGMATLLLHIKADRDSPESPHTIPIFADVTFPTSLTSLISGERIANTESASLTTQSNFTVTVLPPLRLDEYLNNFYNSWLAPVTGIAGLAAVISPLFIYLYKKKKKQKNVKKAKSTT
jgi:hypothetical protein